MTSHLHIPSLRQAALGAALLVASAMLAACGGGSSAGSAGSSSNALVQLRPESGGSGSLLVNRQGMTLYTLSAEKHGNLICKAGAMVPGGSASCLSVWKPLLASGGSTATGVQGLSTLRRSDGQGVQVTYRGLPLYTFTGDKAPGDTAGNGFRDVGVWHVAETATSAPTASSSGGSGGYGY